MMKRFETPAAQRQYEQILCREPALVAKLRNVVALQWVNAKGGPLQRFTPFEDAFLCILTSGTLVGREITRFTVMRGAHDVVDWDMHRICRLSGPRHVPNPSSKFFEFALALDAARAASVMGGTLPNLRKLELPKMVVRSSAPAALPVVNKHGELCVPEQLSAEFHTLTAAEKILAVRAAMLTNSVKTEAGIFTPVEMIDPCLLSRLDLQRDLIDWLGVTINNPLQKYLELPNPLAPIPHELRTSELAVARKRLGDAQALFHDEDLLEPGELVRASGKRQATVAELTPLLRRTLGVVFEQMTQKQIEQMIMFPATPVAVNTVGKPRFYWKGSASNTEALQDSGIACPELPDCFLPRE